MICLGRRWEMVKFQLCVLGRLVSSLFKTYRLVLASSGLLASTSFKVTLLMVELRVRGGFDRAPACCASWKLKIP